MKKSYLKVGVKILVWEILVNVYNELKNIVCIFMK